MKEKLEIDMRDHLQRCESVAVWFNKDVNSGVFDSGENYIWIINILRR